MNIIDLDLPDFSGHPPPPQVTLDVYEKWVFELLASGMRPEMTDEQLVADFMKNEGRQTEEWPDFGDCAATKTTQPIENSREVSRSSLSNGTA